MKTHLKYLSSLLIICSIVYCQDEENISRLCNNKKTCSDCITSHARCGWCKSRDFEKTKASRCEAMHKLTDRCPIDDIISPKREFGDEYNKQLSPSGADPKDIVQIYPQRVNLTLRPRDNFPLTLKFRQAEDYPVDLYYLMDLSKSMEDDKEKLYLLGDLLASDMSKVTKNFQLGFGSFVDKVVMPYVSTVPEKLLEPCTECAAPYGFKNHMKLKKRTEEFKTEVKRARVSGNLDAPEGGFDAIMQSIVCEQEIGWRDKSRKLLVFSTDSGFHYAGDGKLGGIVKPNDGLCHLDNDGYYSESTHQDYPSLSQLNQKAIDKKVHMIFAVTANQADVYKQLSQHLEGASAGTLANDSSNVVDLIKEQYSKITSSVQLKHNASNYIQVKFFSKCLSGNLEETSICSGLKIGNTVSFEAHIRVTHCPKDPALWNQEFSIYPVGLNEALTVNLSMICQCDCEAESERILHSPYCHDGNGTFECGICSCYNNRFGHRCECSPEGDELGQKNVSCIQPGKTTYCSDRGECICGQCQCYTDAGRNYSGDYCECDNKICSFHNSKMCNGRGWCDCGTCVCDDNWTGDSCECYQGTENCKAHPGAAICSGNGTCVCGQCVCGKDPQGSEFSGPYCDECPICGAPRCETYRWCVQCTTFKSGKLRNEEDCKSNCTIPHYIFEVDEAKVENDTERICTYPDDDDCRFTFVYGFFNESSRPDMPPESYVRVQRTKDCPPPLNILMIVLGVIGGIVAIGLCLLLIWKLLTTIHDRREFAKFEKERQMAKWDTGENPIFKGATSTFKNPTYGAK